MKRAVDPITHQFQTLRGLGIREGVDQQLEMWISERDRNRVEEFLAAHWYNRKQMLIGINALASYRWKTKLWPAQSYARIADMLANKFNARVIFTGTKQSTASIEKIISYTQCKPINACGKTSPMQLAALIQSCAVLLTVDSAPMHIAAAVRTPCVALFGPTDPARHLPNTEKFVLIKKDLSCSPCYRTRCFHRRCMFEISVEEVYDAMVELITQRAAAADSGRQMKREEKENNNIK